MIRRFCLTLLGLSFLQQIGSGVEVRLESVRDNTLYETAAGNRSNGEGNRLFAGRTGEGVNSIRRALVAFDVAGSIPLGVTVTSASLTLNMSKTPTSAQQDVSLHPVLQDWAEGQSNASGEEGEGAPAAAGDATWLHALFPDDFWATPGGDFAEQASATVPVGGVGKYTWQSSEMVADVQAWLDQPELNFGWALIGDESRTRTAKRFDSREISNPNNRPLLTIVYGLLGDFDENGELASADIDLLGMEVAAGGGDLRFDLTDDANVNRDDVEAFLALADKHNGDSDFDGQVQFPDFVILANNFGQSGKKWSEGDFDTNGEVQFPDFVILANNFGLGAGGAGAAAVPEPTTPGWLISLAAMWLVRRRAPGR